MAKYEVIRPWNGVEIGDVLELENLHPALKSNVRLMRGAAGGELTQPPRMPATKPSRARMLSRRG